MIPKNAPVRFIQYCPGKFYRKDGLAWKPGGLHRSLWSRRPWDFHAIAPKGRLTPPRRTERTGAKRQTFHGHGTPLRATDGVPSSSRLDRLKKSFWRRKVGRGRAHDCAPGVSAPSFLQELRLCDPFSFPDNSGFIDEESAGSRRLPRGRSRTLKGFGSDHYRVSTPTPIVVDLGPL